MNSNMCVTFESETARLVKGKGGDVYSYRFLLGDQIWNSLI